MDRKDVMRKRMTEKEQGEMQWVKQTELWEGKYAMGERDNV